MAGLAGSLVTPPWGAPVGSGGHRGLTAPSCPGRRSQQTCAAAHWRPVTPPVTAGCSASDWPPLTVAPPCPASPGGWRTPRGVWPGPNPTDAVKGLWQGLSKVGRGGSLHNLSITASSWQWRPQDGGRPTLLPLRRCLPLSHHIGRWCQASGHMLSEVGLRVLVPTLRLILETQHPLCLCLGPVSDKQSPRPQISPLPSRPNTQLPLDASQAHSADLLWSNDAEKHMQLPSQTP